MFRCADPDHNATSQPVPVREPYKNTVNGPYTLTARALTINTTVFTKEITSDPPPDPPDAGGRVRGHARGEARRRVQRMHRVGGHHA